MTLGRFGERSSTRRGHQRRLKATKSVRALVRDDPELIIWILSEVEIASALWRRRRTNESNAVIVADVPAVMRRARRLLGTHTLRSADAMQLAAALLACEDERARLAFVTLDDRLAEAAAREGFAVVP